nr:hypothetical protein [Chromobacterium sp. ASV5]
MFMLGFFAFSIPEPPRSMSHAGAASRAYHVRAFAFRFIFKGFA